MPFYGSIACQNARRSYAYGNIYPLFAQADFLLPFQIMRPTRAGGITSALLLDKDGRLVADITAAILEAGLTVARFEQDGYDVIVYPATLPMALNMESGIHYLTLSDGSQTWYSDMFTVVQDVSPFLKLEWWDAEDLVFDAGRVVYGAAGYRNRLYFATEIGKPDYEFEEEGEERDGYFFAEKRLSWKTYRFNVLAPEYLCDVMRMIPLADYIRVTDKYGTVYRCDTFLVTPEWQTQGDLASATAEFTTDTVVKKIGRGVVPADKGDYNGDFDGDFDNA